MSKNNRGKATFIPAKPYKTNQESPETSEMSPSSLMESLFWQNLGWVHTPPFTGIHLDDPKLPFPSAKKKPSSSKLYLDKSFHPKIQAIVEKHLSEEKRLAEVIPDHMDIGPFRLVLQTVRLAAQKKHRQLADATIEHFHDRLRQDMESTRDQFLVLLDRIAHRTGNIEDLLDKKAWCRGVPRKIENLAEDVNEIRTSFKTLTDVFSSCMVDEDFSLYWKIQEFPQITAKSLAERAESFDQEREVHKENLSTDVRQLEVDLNNISLQVSLLCNHRDISKTSATATHVRQLRKELTACEDKAKLYNKRQRLFGHPQTDYPNIEQMDKDIVPFELFWLNAAEFFKYRERLVAGELVMEPFELKGKIVEFKNNLEKSLEYFVLESDKEIREAVVSVIVEVDEFLNSKWVLPERK